MGTHEDEVRDTQGDRHYIVGLVSLRESSEFSKVIIWRRIAKS